MSRGFFYCTMYNPFNVSLLQESSPWAPLSNWALPNIKWCEATNHISWFTEPANTWSNIAYMVAALLIYLQYRKDGRKISLYFSLAALDVGICSFIYHMSYSFFFQVFDFFSMFVFLFLLITLNLKRLQSKHGNATTLWSGVALFTAITVAGYFLKIKFQVLVMVLILTTLFLEYKVAARYRQQNKKRDFSYKLFLISIAAIFTGSIFSFLDINRIMCFPDHPFLQGHAIWHLMGSVCIYFAYLYYAQFKLYEND